MFELDEIMRLRKKVGLTQKQLAKQSNVSQSLIAKIEAGKIDPAYSNAQKILETLNTLNNESVQAKDILNSNIISIGGDEGLRNAITKMKRYNISQMPVIDSKKIIGLVSEAIILEALINGKTHDDMVCDVMHDSPPILTKNASLSVVTHLLREYPIILISERGSLVGHITKADILTKAF